MRTAELSLFIVEDDPDFRESFIDLMSLRGLTARGAGTAMEGLSALRDCRPGAIVLDVQLPDVHGFELCRRIKRIDAHRKTPIIFLSAAAAYSDPRDRVEGLLAGASLFLPKPISPEQLLAEIERLLDAA
jgi:DNA-binding response OmpR family regulator